MTIQEAIKANETQEVVVIGYIRNKDEYWDVKELSSRTNFSIELIKADWQVVPKTVTITREQLAGAWEKVRYPEKAENSLTFTELCKELGL